MTKETIISLLKNQSEVIKSYGIDRIGLFGSYARSEQTEQSDIDVILKFKAGEKTYRRYIKLVYFLEELFHKKVDGLTYNSLSTDFLKEIEKDITYVSFDS